MHAVVMVCTVVVMIVGVVAVRIMVMAIVIMAVGVIIVVIAVAHGGCGCTLQRGGGDHGFRVRAFGFCRQGDDRGGITQLGQQLVAQLLLFGGLGNGFEAD